MIYTFWNYNMKSIIILFLLVLSFNNNSLAKKPITFEDILKFEDLNFPQLTDNGKWLIYRLDKQRGNNNLIIQSTIDDKKIVIERGVYAQFSDDNKWFAVKTDIDILKQLNPEKYKDEKPDLEIINIEKDTRDTVENASGFKLTKNGKWLAYTLDYDKKDKLKGKKLIIRHLESKTEIPIENVLEYTLDSLGSNLFYSTLKEKSINGIYYRNLKENYIPEKVIESDSLSKFTNLIWNETLENLIYLKGSLLKEDKTKDNALKLFSLNTKKSFVVADTSSREGYYIPEKNDIQFTEDNNRLWFGYKPIGERYDIIKDTTIITEENLYNTDLILDNTELYLWHPNDPEIIPYQRTNWDKEKDNVYFSIYDLKTQKINYLTDSTEKGVEFTNNINFALQYDNEPHSKLMTYSGWYQDVYAINVKKNEKILIDSVLEDLPRLSPQGLYTVYFKNKDWYSFNNQTKVKVKLNLDNNTPFYDVLDDHPKEPGSYGIKGWIGQDKKVLIGDQFDIWEFDLTNGKSKLLTNGFGRKNEINISILNFDKNKKWFDDNSKVLVKLYGIKTKDSQLGILDLSTGNIETKTKGDYLYTILGKSDNSAEVIFTKEGFNTYPDVWLSDTTLINFKQLTKLQSQVDEFNWGTSHLVEFETKFGDTLQGYYALPDNYKKGKKYPVFVYFYERFSDRKNEFNMPKINHRPPYSLYLGSDYVMFFPDVKFYDGDPGESSKAALIAGCDKLIEMGIADPEKIVIHGHSWSGYESAWIVTQTDYFAACVSGAPVANMTSAYSGIRLGSGLARQFQYEKEQSRIGGNLIDSLDSYIRNSPIFFADKMNTPLLVMFGDKDDAVPFDQGVELYLAMRRFDKNCIFLQYEGEPHHPRKIQNQLDYSIRMKQFMDYYVFGGEMPKWMVDGFRYKGKFNTGR